MPQLETGLRKNDIIVQYNQNAKLENQNGRQYENNQRNEQSIRTLESHR
jgi:hypothetical protein